ncbi:MAG: PKD domain-containing protein [Gammaproteobacteria bacterium]
MPFITATRDFSLSKRLSHSALALSLLLLLSTPLLSTPLLGKPLTEHELQQLLPLTRLELAMPELKQQAASASKPDRRQPQRHMIARAKRIAQPLEALTSWQYIDDKAILRLALDAPQAKHLNLGFDQVALPEGAQLYIFNAHNNQLIERYNHRDVSNRQLWTSQLQTNSVIIELQVAEHLKDQLTISLRQAGLGDKTFSADSWLKSGSCNIDINCSEGDNWRDVSRSVARYLISDSTGTFTCTGSLMNNDRFDQRPLFMTAAHCGVAESTVDSMRFFWNYETSVCDGTPDGDLSQTQTGARFISRGEGTGARSDFALVELAQSPANEFNVYFTGWNAVAQEAANVVTIHHPAGDEKRISLDADPLTITLYGNDPADVTGQYYRIEAWDVGTTEGGSSGSGIWNQQKQLIGTLSGGLASCTAPAESDWYGRMSDHWQSAGEHPLLNSAKALAPTTANRTLSGLESCDGAMIDMVISDSSAAPDTAIDLSANVTSGVAPYEYAWDFNNDGVVDSNDPQPSHSYSQSGEYEVYLMITDANQCRTASRSRIIVPDPSERFLADGVKPTNYVSTVDAEGTWVVTSDTAAEGVFSLRSQVINSDEKALIATTDTFSNGSVSFSYKVSSESGFDKLLFFIDGVEQLSVDGETDWTTATFNISSGSRTLRWEYVKDASVSVGVDTAWIDDVQFTADPTTPVTPPPTSSGGGGSVPWTLALLLLLVGCLRRVTCP